MTDEITTALAHVPAPARAAIAASLRRLDVPAHHGFAGVELWTLDSGAARRAVEIIAVALPAAERERAAQWARDGRGGVRAAAFVLGRAVLRSLLARRGVAFDTPLIAGAYGRLVLPDGPAFSVSYAEGTVVVAIGAMDTPAIGVDVERRRLLEDVSALAEAAQLTPDELASLQGNRAAASEPFLRLWTLKEAVAKAAGTGLGSTAWQVPVANCAAPQVVRRGSEAWVVAGVGGLSGHHLAVAAAIA